MEQIFLGQTGFQRDKFYALVCSTGAPSAWATQERIDRQNVILTRIKNQFGNVLKQRIDSVETRVNAPVDSVTEPHVNQEIRAQWANSKSAATSALDGMLTIEQQLGVYFADLSEQGIKEQLDRMANILTHVGSPGVNKDTGEVMAYIPPAEELDNEAAAGQ